MSKWQIWFNEDGRAESFFRLVMATDITMAEFLSGDMASRGGLSIAGISLFLEK